jgi:hypothetical protein
MTPSGPPPDMAGREPLPRGRATRPPGVRPEGSAHSFKGAGPPRGPCTHGERHPHTRPAGYDRRTAGAARAAGMEQGGRTCPRAADAPARGAGDASTWRGGASTRERALFVGGAYTGMGAVPVLARAATAPVHREVGAAAPAHLLGRLRPLAPGGVPSPGGARTARPCPGPTGPRREAGDASARGSTRGASPGPQGARTRGRERYPCPRGEERRPCSREQRCPVNRGSPWERGRPGHGGPRGYGSTAKPSSSTSARSSHSRTTSTTAIAG